MVAVADCYLARSTPTDLVLEAFKLFDDDIHHCFMDSIGVSLASTVHGSLGLRSLSLLSSSACISLLSVPLVLLILKTYTCCDSKDIHLTNAIDHFNSQIEKLSVISIFSSPVSQRLLSSKVNDHCFLNLFYRSSRASKAIGCYQFQHLMPPVIPFTSQGLHLTPLNSG